MAIKMRTNKEQQSRCCECNAPRSHSIEMFDVCIGGEVITLCDSCVGQLNAKTLSAICMVNHKPKSMEDMRVIRKRINRQHNKRQEEQQDE